LLKNHQWLGQAAEGGLAGPENPEDFWAAEWSRIHSGVNEDQFFNNL